MVARPDHPFLIKLAVNILRKKSLDNLEQLLKKFEAWHKEPPAMVLLYNWATPCPKCTEQLLIADNFLCQMYPTLTVHSQSPILLTENGKDQE